MGVDDYTVYLTDKLEQGESAGSVTEFFLLDINSLVRCIEKQYGL